jgi:hypothetical protein
MYASQHLATWASEVLEGHNEKTHNRKQTMVRAIPFPSDMPRLIRHRDTQVTGIPTDARSERQHRATSHQYLPMDFGT